MNKAFDKLAHALRQFMERVFESKELLEIDEDESIGNMESSFEAVLNSFHSLKDISEKKGIQFDWYNQVQPFLLITIRNARHHNISNNIRSIFNKVKYSKQIESIICVNFEAVEEGANCFEYYISWYDLISLFDLSPKVSKIKNPQQKKLLIIDYLDGERLNSYSKLYKTNAENIFINVVPLIINSMTSLFPVFNRYIDNYLSVESEAFFEHFSISQGFDLHKHKIQKIQ